MRRNLSTRKVGELLRVLPGGPAGTLIASGALAGSYGEAITFARTSEARCLNASGQLSTLTSGQPRVEPKGLLIERAGTNSVLRSQEFNNAAWTRGQGAGQLPTLTQNTNEVTAPDGTNTACKLALTAVTGSQGSQIYQGVTTTAAAWTWSIWVRGAGESGTIWMQFSPDGTTWQRVACPYTDGVWTRCSGTLTMTATIWYMHIGQDLRDTGVTAQGAKNVYVWGAQGEVGQFATSYIPTAGASATRAVETATIANPLASGTTRWELTATIDGTTWPSTAGNFILQLGDSYASNDTATLRLEDATGKPMFVVFDNAGGSKYVLGPSALTTGRHTLRAVNDGGTLSLYVDGVSQGAATGTGTGTITTMPATIRVGGSNASGGAPLNANIHSIKVRKL